MSSSESSRPPDVWQLDVAPSTGCLRSAQRASDPNGAVRFRGDAFAGPRWFLDFGQCEHRLDLAPAPGGGWATRFGDVTFSLSYRIDGNKWWLDAAIRNGSRQAFAPKRAGLRLGIDMCMERFPEWNRQYFPTLLRCERTHFWGYFMTPEGRLLGIGSPDPVAAWSLDYNQSYQGPVLHNGHRIATAVLVLLTSLPLPERHPSDVRAVAPGEERVWRVGFAPVASIAALAPTLAPICDAPLLQFARHTLAPGEATELTMACDSEPQVETETQPDGHRSPVPVRAAGAGRWTASIAAGEPGQRTIIRVRNAAGRVSEGVLYCRDSWSWYLRQARAEAARCPQKPGTHSESWLGYYSAFLARRHFPQPELDTALERRFRQDLRLMYDPSTGLPLSDPGRIQNTTCMIGALVDCYQATGTMADLELAATLADWLVATRQDETDGSYRGGALRGAHRGEGEGVAAGQISALDEWVHYTCVIYPAKSMLELVLAERELGRADPAWRSRAERHLASVRRAVDDLARRLDDIGTEGEITFEDGMISCSALQLGLLALMEDEPQARRRLAAAAAQMMAKHACLEQNAIPDARMHAATIRFWEFQYDVCGEKNLISSPHAWSSFRAYASWYLYLLTGEPAHLRAAMDAVGTLVQLIDRGTGTLRWGFAVDPLVETGVWQEDPARRGAPTMVPQVLGECYVPMVSHWWRAPENTAVVGHQKMVVPPSTPAVAWSNLGGCGDNNVHEAFKCLEEIALRFAYVIEGSEGTLQSWNCRVAERAGRLVVVPAEPVVSAVHFNLPRRREVVVEFAGGGTPVEASASGLQWIGIRGVQAGVPWQ